MEQRPTDYRGRQFIAIRDFSKFQRSYDYDTGRPPQLMHNEGPLVVDVLTSPELPVNINANEIVVSWNADMPATSALWIEARAIYNDHITKWYSLGQWSLDEKMGQRASVKGQKDADGDVHTDTLALNRSPERLQVRVARFQHRTSGEPPTLKFLGISLAETQAAPPALEPNKTVWGREITVPGRTQLGWPGANGWCSPTSTDMALAFWAQN